MTLNFDKHFCPANDVVFGVMFGKRVLFCKLIHAATGDKIELDSDPHTQATLREDDVLLNVIKFDILVYIPTVLKTYDKNSDLYIFAQFFKITSQKKADAFAKRFGAHDLGMELIKMYNAATANAQELQKIESRPYFLGRLTEAQLEEERRKARKKGEEIGKQIGEKIGKQIGEKIGKQIGEKIGEQRGKQIGEKIGEQRGKQIGANEKAIKAAKNMLSRGVAPELIADYLELDINTIRSLMS